MLRTTTCLTTVPPGGGHEMTILVTMSSIDDKYIKPNESIRSVVVRTLTNDDNIQLMHSHALALSQVLQKPVKGFIRRIAAIAQDWQSLGPWCNMTVQVVSLSNFFPHVRQPNSRHMQSTHAVKDLHCTESAGWVRTAFRSHPYATLWVVHRA